MRLVHIGEHDEILANIEADFGSFTMLEAQDVTEAISCMDTRSWQAGISGLRRGTGHHRSARAVSRLRGRERGHS